MQPASDSSLTHRGMDAGIVVLTLLAPALGGATELWAQAVVVLCGALVILVAPPSRGLPTWQWISLGALACLTLVAFLPAAWFRPLPLRTRLITDPNLALPLPATLSLQPWVSLENGLLFGLGLLWAAYLLCRSWATRRRTLLSLYGVGLAVLVGVAMAFFLAGDQLEFWNTYNDRFGFFPNRNQMGNVLALGGILMLALAVHHLVRNHARAPWWVMGYVLVGVAVVVNGSRAGVLVYGIGSMLWLIWTTTKTQSLRRFSLGLAGVLALVTLFFLFGGSTLERFMQLGQPLPSVTENVERRTDPGAYRLLQTASWHGIGLGNFEPVFAQYRVAVDREKRAIHPESDWVWAGIELGWLGPVLLLGAVLVYLIAHWPQPREPDFHLRSALVVGVLLFLLHGFVDVSGHRMGSVWPVLLLLGLVREPLARRGPARRSIALAFRALAVVAVAVAVGWALSGAGIRTWPNSARAEWLHRQIDLAMAGPRYDAAIRQASEGLRWAPLDWEFYFYRALAATYWTNAPDDSLEQPLRDFARARFLQPWSPRIPFEEAHAWLMREPSLAFGAWVETLRRAGDRRGTYFQEILDMGQGVPGVEEELFSLAIGDPELLLIFMAWASPEEFQQELAKLLLDDPDLKTLSAKQRQRLFGLWTQKGDAQAFEERLAEQAAWLPDAWIPLARLYGSRKEYERACELARQHAEPALLPQVVSEKPLVDLQAEAWLSPTNFTAVYGLYEAQMRLGQAEDALATLAKVTARSGCPRYLHFLEAQLHLQKSDWESAWRAWNRYLN